jgi:hypothetical protein
VRALAAAGLRWQPILDYATAWAATPGAGQNPGVAPAHVGDYVAYAKAFAARYGPGGSFWAQNPSLQQLPVNVFEIWNEPDLPQFWSPAPNLAEYAWMYMDARAAIKSVAPSTKVIVGGLVFPRQSMPALVTALPAMRGSVDGVGIHPYRGTLDLLITAVNYDLQTDAATLGAPLYVNEYGWGATSAWWPDQTEAQRDASYGLATEWLGRNPYIADVEAYCWGCDRLYEIYNTPAGAAFAAGIAADQRQSRSPDTPTASKVASSATVRRKERSQRHKPTSRHHKKQKHKRRHHKHHAKHKHAKHKRS